ncbi:hypothetical protein Poly30_48040 [Planctomycetes bacterium Poly30]|uniref:Uncharacterized protein n=1 Tax=Saltatorellus ferox TaxID=2528018 RepID=A0A518EYS3_9BACT|nr:hypothetical protein Poly30_48040 [Planctomycetes bacterium Poly30]
MIRSPGSFAGLFVLAVFLFLVSSSPCRAQIPCSPQQLELAGEDFVAVDSTGSTLLAYDVNAERIVPFEWSQGVWIRGIPSDPLATSTTPSRVFLSMAQDVVVVVNGYDYGYLINVLERQGQAWVVTYSHGTFASAAVAFADDRHEVAINPAGNFIAVGFPGDNYGAGAVDTYRLTAGGWNFGGGLFAVQGNSAYNGTSVAMTDGTLVTTQPNSTGLSGSPFRGSIAVFALPSGVGSPTVETILAPPASYTAFGVEVVTDGDWVVALSRGGGTRPIDLFHRDSFGWNYEGRLSLPAPFVNQPILGLELRGTRLLVAASGAGGLHEFRLDDGGATPVGVSLPPGLAEPIHRSDYGNELSTAVGFVSHPEQALIVSYCGCSQGGSCGTSASSSAGCLNAAGIHAELRGCGSTRVTVDDLMLRVEGLTPNTWVVPFMGRATSGVALHNGVLCISSPSYRYAPVPASGSTANVLGLVAQSHALHPAAAQLAAGQTWSFQAWYRDVGGPCGAASNFTNALTVTFEL